MMILPSTSDGEALLTCCGACSYAPLEPPCCGSRRSPPRCALARRGHRPDPDHEPAAYSGVLEHHRRRQNNLLNYLLHQQLRITSVISSLRRMLLNWPDRPANLMPVITQLLDELRDPPPTSTVWRACFSRSRRKARTTAIAPSGCACAISAGFTCAATAGCSGWSATAVSELQPPRVTRWRAIPTTTKPPTTVYAPFCAS